MKTNELASVLSDACQEVLEKMMFLEAHPRTPYAAGEYVLEKELVGAITFHGELNGRIIINCSRRLAEVATMGLLGIEPGQVQEGQTEDTVKEMANMVCGNLFGKLNTERSLAKLDIPLCLDLKESPPSLFAAAEVMVFPFSCGALTPESDDEEIFLLEMELIPSPNDINDSTKEHE